MVCRPRSSGSNNRYKGRRVVKSGFMLHEGLGFVVVDHACYMIYGTSMERLTLTKPKTQASTMSFFS